MDFKKEFFNEFQKQKPNLNFLGAITEDGEIYSFGTDTKVISTLFELVLTPIVEKIAEKHKLKIIISPEQTVYPDFTLIKSEDDKNKIAIDVKTTYIKKNAKGNTLSFGFTLGSYTSFIRNNTKNIAYPYSDYKEHWIIGFIYHRIEVLPDVLKTKDISKLNPPYEKVNFFVQEKYKIAGDKPGSGNTANIGSFKSSDISDFDEGKGPFSELGEEEFKNYWSNFDRFPPKKYVNLKEYLEWKSKES